MIAQQHNLNVADRRPVRLVRGLCLLACACLCALVPAAPAAAQSVWELVPYRIQLLVALAPEPEFTPGLQADLLRDLVNRTDALVGAPWDLTAAAAGPELRPAMTFAVEAVTVQSLPKESLDFDKVMLLVVLPAANGYRVTARELDVRTRRWSSPVVRPVRQLCKLRDAALGAMLEAFAPLARVQSVEKKLVVLRLKAGALPPRDASLALVRPGDVFCPIIRYNDREGNFRRRREGGTILPEPIPWTYCIVQKVAPMELECRLHTGLRAALSGRRRGRIEQLALAVVPPSKPSTLILEARTEPDADPKPKQLLAGYDVYAHPPDSKTTVRLGRTDRHGRLVVPPAENPLRLLVVLHGGEPMAQFPVVPGLQPELTAKVPNDDERLAAEGFITGLQEDLVDLVIRREVLIARTKARIEAGQFDEAAKLVEELLRLDKSHSDLATLLSQQRRRIRSRDPDVQTKIDDLFGDTEKLLQKHLDPEPVNELREYFGEARAAAGA